MLQLEVTSIQMSRSPGVPSCFYPCNILKWSRLGNWWPEMNGCCVMAFSGLSCFSFDKVEGLVNDAQKENHSNSCDSCHIVLACENSSHQKLTNRCPCRMMSNSAKNLCICAVASCRKILGRTGTRQCLVQGILCLLTCKSLKWQVWTVLNFDWNHFLSSTIFIMKQLQSWFTPEVNRLCSTLGS